MREEAGGHDDNDYIEDDDDDDRSTWSKFGAHGEHGDVFLFSNLGAL